MFDESAITAAVSETLGLIIAAIDQTQSYQEKRKTFQQTSDVVDSFDSNFLAVEYELAGDLDCLLQESKWNSQTVDDNQEEKDVSQLREIYGIERNNYDKTISMKDENDSLETYWKRVCQNDDLEYQDDCVATKAWLKNEINHLEMRAQKRAKYAEQARKENASTKIQTVWRLFNCKKEFRVLQTSFNIICRWLRKCVVRRRYLSNIDRSTKTSTLVIGVVALVLESIIDFYLHFTLTTSINEMRDFAAASFSTQNTSFYSPETTQTSNINSVNRILFRSIRCNACIPWRVGSSQPKLFNTSLYELHGKPRKPSQIVGKLLRGKDVGPTKTKSSLRSKFVFDDQESTKSGLSETVQNATKCISGDADTFGTSYSDYSVESLTDSFFLSKSSIFGETVIANVNKVCSLSSFFGITKLKTLSLNDNCITSCDELPNFESLRHANLESNKIEAAVNLSVPMLKSLSLNCNKIQSFAAKVSALRRLSLYSNYISSFELVFDPPLSSLVYLNLGRNRLETLNWNVISHLHFLSTLILSQNCLQHFPSNVSLPFLQSLWLNGNRISGVIHNRKQSLNFPMLKRLYLQDNKITNIRKCFALCCPNLVELDISFNEISSSVILRGLCAFQQLKLLRLSDNPLVASSGANVALESFTMNMQYYSGNKFFEWPYVGNQKLQLVLHEIYCMRNTLDLFYFKRKRLLSELRQNGGKFADIEVAAFTDDVFFQCAMMLISPDYNSYRPSSITLAVASSSIAQASLKITQKSFEKSHEMLERKLITPPAVEKSMQTGTDNEFIDISPDMNNILQSPLSDPGEKIGQIHENAAKILQRFFLAHRNKKLIKNVLETVRYKDDEVDKLLSEDLEMDWLENFCYDEAISSSITLTEREPINQNVVGSSAIAYGDHIRKRNFQLDMNEIKRLDSEEVKILTSKSVPINKEKSIKSSKASEIRDEWGIQNDCLLSTMLKREKKLRKRKDAHGRK